MKLTRRPTLFILLGLLFISGCQESAERPLVISLWHQMTPAERRVLAIRIDAFHGSHPEIHVESLYKETEELRSGFQAAALAGAGPELVYGPSDAMGPFTTMGIIQDLQPWFSEQELQQFLPQALTYLPNATQSERHALVQVGDRLGNHLALVYNRHLLPEPPKTTDELVQMAVAQTLDKNNDGRTDQYGLVWNFVEPFMLIPFLTGHGAWIFEDSPAAHAGSPPVPNLSTTQCVAALKFVLSLRDEYQVIPANCDYENADALFKQGQAAMIINGDWSWSDYLANERIDAAIAVLPIVSSTGIPMGPMVATKGYSLNVHATGPAAEAAAQFVRFMISEDTQRVFMQELKTLPSRKSLQADPMLQVDPTLRVSAEQMRNGRPMPVHSELRAVWDAMRPAYQALLGGSLAPEQAATEMQAAAVANIAQMNRQVEPTATGVAFHVIAILLSLGLLFWQRHAFYNFVAQWQENRFAYLLVGPAMAVIALTIVYPFFYNVVLSFSNMSLRNFQEWQVIGPQNYVQVFDDKELLVVFGKTILWTVVNVFFHVSIGLLLAVTLNGPLWGKSVYRTLLILPWAVPAYITALTWRGMFDYDYGAINLMANQYLGLPPVNWLGEPWNAFLACILTNVWLGFPFMMVISLGGLQGIPQELYEAAQMDRVGRWGQFWHITLPMLRPVLAPAATLGAIWTFNNLNVVWLVSNGGEPSNKTHILVSYVYKAVFNLYQYGYGAALSIVIFGVLLVFTLTLMRRE